MLIFCFVTLMHQQCSTLITRVQICKCQIGTCHLLLSLVVSKYYISIKLVSDWRGQVCGQRYLFTRTLQTITDRQIEKPRQILDLLDNLFDPSRSLSNSFPFSTLTRHLKNRSNHLCHLAVHRKTRFQFCSSMNR